MNPDDLITLNEEIAGMARAGLPLDQGLAALAREMGRGRLQAVTAGLAADLRAGHPLPEALRRQGGRVPPFYAGLVAAGIRSGRLAEVLATLTTYARSIADLRAAVVGAVFYPAVVLAVSTALFGGFAFFILPQFDRIFKDFHLKLPQATVWALAAAQHPLFVGLVLIAWVALWVGILRVILHNKGSGRLGWTRLGYAVPIVGTLVRSMRLAAFAELLAILVDQEVPLPEAFRLAGEASSDPFTAASSQQVQQDLAEGMPLWAVLRSRQLVPELIAWMTGLGERRGDLGKAMHQVAQIYRRQVEVRAAILRSVLPPLLIIFTAGTLVGYFALAILLPMYKLLEGLSK